MCCALSCIKRDGFNGWVSVCVLSVNSLSLVCVICSLCFECVLLFVVSVDSIPFFFLFGLFVCGCVCWWVAMGHDARGWECHIDARLRLRHRAVFNVSRGLLC